MKERETSNPSLRISLLAVLLGLTAALSMAAGFRSEAASVTCEDVTGCSGGLAACEAGTASGCFLYCDAGEVLSCRPNPPW